MFLFINLGGDLLWRRKGLAPEGDALGDSDDLVPEIPIEGACSQATYLGEPWEPN